MAWSDRARRERGGTRMGVLATLEASPAVQLRVRQRGKKVFCSFVSNGMERRLGISQIFVDDPASFNVCRHRDGTSCVHHTTCFCAECAEPFGSVPYSCACCQSLVRKDAHSMGCHGMPWDAWDAWDACSVGLRRRFPLGKCMPPMESHAVCMGMPWDGSLKVM